jgi:hypothetical protein
MTTCDESIISNALIAGAMWGLVISLIVAWIGDAIESRKKRKEEKINGRNDEE